jgi:hypothetical protein
MPPCSQGGFFLLVRTSMGLPAAAVPLHLVSSCYMCQKRALDISYSHYKGAFHKPKNWQFVSFEKLKRRKLLYWLAYSSPQVNTFLKTIYMVNFYMEFINFK